MIVSMDTQDPAEQKVADAIEALIGEVGGVTQLITPRGYPHLGLAILDSMFSLRARYDTVVVPILVRYCEANEAIRWEQRFEPLQTEHGAQALLDFLGPKTSAERCEVLSRHVAPGTSTRKADVCVQIAEVLVENGVDTHIQLGTVLDEKPGLEWDVRKISGVGPAAWRYLLNLSQIEKVKPDVMIVGWVEKQLGRSVGQVEAAHLVEAATAILQQGDLDVSVRTVDHLIWRAQSGREPSKA